MTQNADSVRPGYPFDTRVEFSAASGKWVSYVVDGRTLAVGTQAEVERARGEYLRQIDRSSGGAS